MVACPNCGAQNEDRARFCLECGTRLETATTGHESRRTVTILFSDVVGSTALGEELDPETVRSVMSRYFAAMEGIITAHGGRVEKFVGDAIMAVFGLPQLHEDDALRAARAADEMRIGLARFNESLADSAGVRIEVRTGINTGEVVAGTGTAPTLVTGDPVNTAARLEQAAAAGEILVGATTARLIEHATTLERVDPISAKGKTEAVQALRLVSVGQSVARAVSDSPLIGREAELAELRDAFAEAVSSGQARTVTVLGSAGVGKSRLVNETATMLEASGRARVLRGRCLSYGEGLTYWPLREIVLTAAGAAGAASREEVTQAIAGLLADVVDGPLIVDRLATALGLIDGSVAPDEINWAARRTLERLAADRPLVAIVEDIHWARPAMLELLDYIRAEADCAMLLVCPARPELAETAAEWTAPSRQRRVVDLEGLSPAAGEQLIDATAAGREIPVWLRRRILATAEGNPLFVEELVRLTVDSGDESIAMPPTIEALMAARIDQLSRSERALAQRGAIVGRVFERPSVVALVAPVDRPNVDAHLRALLAKDVLRAEQRPSGGRDVAYKFRHILIRDAAYNAMAKRERAELHELFADWLADSTAGRESEYEDILGHHLEQAYRYRMELRDTGERVERLAERARTHLAAAGKLAFDRGEVVVAGQLYGRAASLAGANKSERAALLVHCAEAGMYTGDYGAVLASADEALTLALAAGAHRNAAKARLLRAEARVGNGEWVRPGPEMAAEIDAAIADAETSGDPLAIAEALQALSTESYYAGQLEKSQVELEKSIEHIRRTDEEMLALSYEANLMTMALVGAAPASQVVDIGRRLLERVGRYPGLRIDTLRLLAVAEAMVGSFDDAHVHIAESLRMSEELGRMAEIVEILGDTGWVERLAGDQAAAERALRRGLDVGHANGQTDSPWIASRLAVLLAGQGRFSDAMPVLEESEKLPSVTNRTRTIGMRARMKATAGDASAVDDVAEMLALLEASGFVNVRTDAFIDAAEVMAALGDRDAAIAYWRQALELCGQKENLALAEQLRERMRQFESV